MAAYRATAVALLASIAFPGKGWERQVCAAGASAPRGPIGAAGGARGGVDAGGARPIDTRGALCAIMRAPCWASGNMRTDGR